MALLGVIPLPDIVEHFLAYLAVKPAYAIHFLTGIASKGAHTELLAGVLWVCPAHAYEFIPRDAELLGITTHVLAEEALIEIIMSGRHRSVYGVETAGTQSSRA